MSSWQPFSLGDVTYESRERYGVSDEILPVYGVDRHVGLTPDAKYKSKDLTKYKLLRPGMFAYNPMRLNIGSIAFCSERHEVGLVSPDYVVFGCHESEVDPEYFKLLVEGREWAHWTAAAGVGSVRVRIYYKELARMPLSIPPIPVQREIARFVKALNDKIELNRGMNETLESMARELFKSWFVDFDPVIDNALAAGNAIPEPLADRAAIRRALSASRKPLPVNIQRLFPDTFAFDEEMGWIPKGWNVVNLDECCLFQEGYVNPSQKIAEYFGDDIKWLRAVDLNDGFVFDTTRKISRAGFESAGKAAYLFQPDSIAISKSGTIGRVGILKDFMCGNRAVINVQPRPEKCGTQFVFRVLKFYNRSICELAIGSVQRNLYASALGSQKFVYPTIGLIRLFEEESGAFSSRMASIVFESISLSQIRDTLLPKLLSGELRIPEAERLVAGSV